MSGAVFTSHLKLERTKNCMLKYAERAMTSVVRRRYTEMLGHDLVSYAA